MAGRLPASGQLYKNFSWGKVDSDKIQEFHLHVLSFLENKNVEDLESSPWINLDDARLKVFSLFLSERQRYIIIFHLPLHGVSESGLKAIEPVAELFKQVLMSHFELDVLQDEMTKYSHLFSAAPEGIVMLNTQNCILEVNPVFEQMFQYPASEIIGRNIDDLIAPGLLNESARLLSSSNWSGNQVMVESRRMRRDGTMVDVSIMGVPFYHASGQLRVFGIYRDISIQVKNQLQTQRWIEFIEYINQLSFRLINMDINNMDDIILNALEKVGSLYGAERVYIACYDAAQARVNLTHEYAFDKRFSHKQLIPSIQIVEIQEFIRKMEDGELLHFQRSDGDTASGYGEMLYFFDLLNVETMIAIPLTGEQQFLGFIGFDTYSRPAQWHENTLNAFRLTAQIMANTLARKQRESALKNALIQAESSDKLKSAFLAGISHEIRTPMNHILGFLSMLDDPDIQAKERSEYLSIIKNSSQKLLQLLDDVIKTALIDSGQLSYRPQPCQLNRFMESLLIQAEGTKVSLKRKDIKINLLIDQQMGDELIETDETKLKQILWNLLTNAIKYTTNGMIDFGYVLTAEYIKFFVSDTGIGIDEDKQSSIFDRFYRIEHDLNREMGGAGLGLSISQGLASFIGEPIQINSTPGAGSTFRFSIPRKEYQLPQPATGTNGYRTRVYDWKGKKILMVEDDPVNMRFLAVMLLRTNAELFYAADGAEAVKIVENQPLDLVLMDMQLPIMDGFEATRRIKSINQKLPVIAQTAMALNADKQRCIDAGCDDYLAKPIGRLQLYEAADRLLFKDKFN
ncbi:hypothetical protein MASR1M74_18970 [Lentimicrobium sp.]